MGKKEDTFSRSMDKVDEDIDTFIDQLLFDFDFLAALKKRFTNDQIVAFLEIYSTWLDKQEHP
jgi:hypothetical protein